MELQKNDQVGGNINNVLEHQVPVLSHPEDLSTKNVTAENQQLWVICVKAVLPEISLILTNTTHGLQVNIDNIMVDL